MSADKDFFSNDDIHTCIHITNIIAVWRTRVIIRIFSAVVPQRVPCMVVYKKTLASDHSDPHLTPYTPV